MTADQPQPSPPKRLVLVSSRARNKLAVYASVLPGVITMEYSYETFSVEDIMELIQIKFKVEKVAKVASIALVLHTSEKELFISSVDNARLNLQTIINDANVRDFFVHMVKRHLDMDNWSARVDFLATYAAEQIDGNLICRTLKQMLGCEVGMIKDLEGKNFKVNCGNKNVPLGQLYFDFAKLKINLDNIGRVGKDGTKKLKG